MAPVTRRSARKIAEAKAQDESILSMADDVANKVEEVETLLEKEPASSPRGKRKSTSENENNNESDHEGGAPLNQALTSPKRQRLAVRTREDESTPNGGRKTHLEVEIPVTATSSVPRSDPIPDSQDEAEAEAAEPEIEPTSASKQLEEDAIHRLASLEPEQTPMAKPKPKAKHITFGDDNGVDQFVTAAAAAPAKTQVDADDDKEDSDDDEAPEAVSTQAVAKKLQEAAQVASEAADKQAASLKRKRQEKDSMYKQQAEQRRKRVRGVEVYQSATTERASSVSTSDSVAEVEKAATAGRRQRAERFNLPTILPPEFLTDSSDDEDMEDAAALKKIVKNPRKINFEEDTANKRPRDKTVGTTRYRVLAKQGDEALAPRAHKSARVSKESLLKRGRVASQPFRKGFLIKR